MPAQPSPAGEPIPEVCHAEDVRTAPVEARRLKSLERVQADEPEDDGEDIFTATFQVDGPNANAEVEIIVSDYVDEANVVSIALHTLHVSMREWARATENRRIAARGVDELAGG